MNDAWVLVDDENRQAVGPFWSEVEATTWAANNDWEVSDAGDPLGWYTTQLQAPTEAANG